MGRRDADRRVLEEALRDEENHALSTNALALKLGLGWDFVNHHRWSFQPRMQTYDARGRRIGRRKPASPASARRRSRTKSDVLAELERVRREARRDTDNKIAVYRSRENRQVWPKVAVQALRVVGELMPPELAVPIGMQGFVQVELDGEIVTIAPRDSDIGLIQDMAAIVEDVDDDADEQALRIATTTSARARVGSEQDVLAVIEKRITDYVRSL